MVFFNYATMQMAAKIVYYGPGLCGKTTNLHFIYGKTAPTSRGEMISLETETDRTLFFDLLPLDVGVIGGFKTRLQLYTVPGQVFYNTTRKLVLRGVDGIVFVADSQRAMKDANAESFHNMESNLEEIGLTVGDIPLVLQFNKRDLGNILTVEELNEALDPRGRYPHVEASALAGSGVFETLKEISKLTLKSLKQKMMGEEKAPARKLVPEAPPPAPPPPKPPPPPPAEEPRVSLSDLRADAEAAASALAEQIETEGILAHAEAIEDLPPADVIEEPAAPAAAGAGAPPAGVPAPAPEVTVDFEQAREIEPVQEIKHVRVRSNVDILAELEKLRKDATLRPLPAAEEPAGASRARRLATDALSVDDILGQKANHRREIAQQFDLSVPRKDLARAEKMIVSLRLGDGDDRALGPEQKVEIPLSEMGDIRKLLVALKLTLSGK